MEAVVRDVRDLNKTERSAIERLVGHALQEDQKLVIQVMNGTPVAATPAGGPLPEWTRVYEGLSDQQIDELEKIVLERANLTRSR
jgi:hypothetical protein